MRRFPEKDIREGNQDQGSGGSKQKGDLPAHQPKWWTAQSFGKKNIIAKISGRRMFSRLWGKNQDVGNFGLREPSHKNKGFWVWKINWEEKERPGKSGQEVGRRREQEKVIRRGEKKTDEIATWKQLIGGKKPILKFESERNGEIYWWTEAINNNLQKQNCWSGFIHRKSRPLYGSCPRELPQWKLNFKEKQVWAWTLVCLTS